jgi:hypothetical protein
VDELGVVDDPVVLPAKLFAFPTAAKKTQDRFAALLDLIRISLVGRDCLGAERMSGED